MSINFFYSFLFICDIPSHDGPSSQKLSIYKKLNWFNLAVYKLIQRSYTNSNVPSFPENRSSSSKVYKAESTKNNSRRERAIDFHLTCQGPYPWHKSIPTTRTKPVQSIKCPIAPTKLIIMWNSPNFKTIWNKSLALDSSFTIMKDFQNKGWSNVTIGGNPYFYIAQLWSLMLI